jgi:hypothetical protein
VAEIWIERRRHNVLPWIIGLVLLTLLILGMFETARRGRAAGRVRGTAAVDTTTDPTPPHLRQFALLTAPGAPSARYAA